MLINASQHTQQQASKRAYVSPALELQEQWHAAIQLQTTSLPVGPGSSSLFGAPAFDSIDTP